MGRRAIFEGDADCQGFLDLLGTSAARFDVAVHAFVLMGNHFHLLAQTRRPNLSRWMQTFLGAYTAAFQHRHRRVGHGHLFQGRFKSHLVEEQGYFLSVSRYLHLNPVRGQTLGQGDVPERRARLRAYPWSSYPGYAGLGPAAPFVQEHALLAETAANLLPAGVTEAEYRRGYRRHVEAGLLAGVEDPFARLHGQAILGSEAFAQRALDRLSDWRERRRETTGVRRLRPRGIGCDSAPLLPATILEVVAARYGLETATELNAPAGRQRWSEARGVAMTLVHRLCPELGYRRIGELFGGTDYAAVAQRIRRVNLRDAAMELQVPLSELEVVCRRPERT